MKLIHVLPAALVALGVMLSPKCALGYDTCSNEANYAAGWINAQDSMDDVLVAHWCGSPDPQGAVDYYWNTLGLGANGFWTAQAAYEHASCNDPNGGFIRLLNAASALDWVWYQMSASTLGQAAWSRWWLGDFVGKYYDDGYTANCSTKSVATHYPGGPITFHYPFFYTYDVFSRASTMVHEVAHEWSSHTSPVCPDQWCSANWGATGDGSCDVAYGHSNAQSWQIAFLDQAVQSYQRRPDSTELAIINYGNGYCGYVPLLSELTRRAALGLMNWKINGCFDSPPIMSLPVSAGFVLTDDPPWSYGGVKYAIDEYFGAKWPCGHICDPNAFSFPGGNLACNEAWRAENAAVNAANRAACVGVEAKIEAGLSADGWAKLQKSFSPGACVPGISEDYAHAYCAALVETAPNVAALEAAWELPDQPGGFDSGQALDACVRVYCQLTFDAAWKTDARGACYEWDEDPRGCLKSVCPPLAATKDQYGADSVTYFEAVQCVRHFIDHAGDPAAYGPPADVCSEQLRDCEDAKIYAAWLAERQGGTCSLVTGGSTSPPAPTSGGVYHLEALFTVTSATSYEVFQRTFPTATIDECLIEVVSCQAMQDALTAAVAELLYVTEGRYGLERGPSEPDPGPEWGVSLVERNVRDLVSIVVSPTGPDLTQKDARRLLVTIPEATHALAHLLGEGTYFAAFGTSGQEAVFGPDVATTHAGATIPEPAAASPAQRVAAGRLVAARDARVRLQSSETDALFAEAVGRLSQAQLFGYAHALAAAETPAALEQVLDELAAEMR